MRLRRFLFGGSLKKMTRQQWDYIGWVVLLSALSGVVTALLADRLA